MYSDTPCLPRSITVVMQVVEGGFRDEGKRPLAFSMLHISLILGEIDTNKRSSLSAISKGGSSFCLLLSHTIFWHSEAQAPNEAREESVGVALASRRAEMRIINCLPFYMGKLEAKEHCPNEMSPKVSYTMKTLYVRAEMTPEKRFR